MGVKDGTEAIRLLTMSRLLQLHSSMVIDNFSSYQPATRRSPVGNNDSRNRSTHRRTTLVPRRNSSFHCKMGISRVVLLPSFQRPQLVSVSSLRYVQETLCRAISVPRSIFEEQFQPIGDCPVGVKNPGLSKIPLSGEGPGFRTADLGCEKCDVGSDSGI